MKRSKRYTREPAQRERGQASKVQSSGDRDAASSRAASRSTVAADFTQARSRRPTRREGPAEPPAADAADDSAGEGERGSKERSLAGIELDGTAELARALWGADAQSALRLRASDGADGPWLTAACACGVVVGMYDTPQNRTFLSDWGDQHRAHRPRR